MRRLLIAACLLLTTPAAVQAQACNSGTVYADRNSNQRQEHGEPGLAGIKVSDGVAVVRTDARGAYALASIPGRARFVIKPAGYDVPVRGNGLPDYWREGQLAANPGHKTAGEPAATPNCGDFALTPATPSPNRKAALNVLVFADPQVKSLADVDYYRRDIVESAMRQGAIDMSHGFGKFYFKGGAADLGLSLGDIVDDDLSLYPAINAATATLGVPWLHAAGNHDLDAGATRDEDTLRTFRHTFGPDTFAWEEPEAVFVVLDDVVAQPGASPAYVGGLRAEQFAFLENYLSTLDRDRLLVLAIHIPLFDAAPGRETFRHADRARLFALLQAFPHVLVLSAHSHTQRQVLHDAAAGWHGVTPLHEYNVGAASGAYWSGAKDAAGIPDTTMSDGTPNGFARLTVQADGQYALSWQPARLANSSPASAEAMSLHAPGVLRRGAYPAWGVYANVYMGRDDSRVDYRIDDGPWQPMRRVLQPDPRLLAENVRDDAAEELRGYDRSPEATPSLHLWRGALPTDLNVGEHRIEVRAFDAWQGEKRAATRYRLAEAPP